MSEQIWTPEQAAQMAMAAQQAAAPQLVISAPFSDTHILSMVAAQLFPNVDCDAQAAVNEAAEIVARAVAMVRAGALNKLVEEIQQAQRQRNGAA